jgi:diguanylate cyclase (GGDEF)-like protein
MLMTDESRARSRRHAAPALPRRAVAAVGIAGGMALGFALDTMTTLPHVHHLYYFPIILAAVTYGIPGGLITPALAILLYHLANARTIGWHYEESDVVQIGLFIAVGMVAAKLANDARRLHRLAMTDDLTGLHNLRSFELETRSLLQRARSERSSICFLVLDVDRLKSINDESGHLAGADAVRTVGRIIATQTPADAISCRYGGDEFVIAMAARPLAAVERLANDLRAATHATAPTLAHLPFPAGTLSISIGLAWRSLDGAPRASTADAVDEEIEALFQTADAALYAAKKNGRNCLHVAGAQNLVLSTPLT